MIKSLRKKLLDSDFFSINKVLQNMYQVDILKCVADAEILISKTPDSILNPNYILDDPFNKGSSKYCNLLLRDYKELLVPRISVEDFYYKLQNIAIIIDIRTREDYEIYHCPNSIHCEDNQSILDLIKYKSGLPIVIIPPSNNISVSSSSSLEQQKEEEKLIAEKVKQVESFLLNNSFYYVSVLHGGINIFKDFLNQKFN
jgi:rhodanese-related sulfurtransferase